mmetsp:Transcript_39093/g.82041  ORF Transcript_39093/g.82041 Transcript_39093/m.82041 type:complete len:98 (+) Transcript_39093:548-841(+)
MQMLQNAKGRIERKLNTPRGKGYASLANTDTELEELGDSFYDEQLRSDGWHLDEVEDDDDLDFDLPTSVAPPQKTLCGRCFSGCLPHWLANALKGTL